MMFGPDRAHFTRYWAVRTVTRISRSRGGFGMTRAVSVNPLADFPSTLTEAMARPVAVRG